MPSMLPRPGVTSLADGLVDAGLVVDDDPTHMVKDMPVIHEPSGLKARMWLAIDLPIEGAA